MSRFVDTTSKAINYRDHHPDPRHVRTQSAHPVSVGNIGRKTNLALLPFSELGAYYKAPDTKPVVQLFILEHRDDPDVRAVMLGAQIPPAPRANWAPFRHVSPNMPDGTRRVHALKHVLAKALPDQCVYIDSDRLRAMLRRIQDFYPGFQPDATGIHLISGMISRVLDGQTVDVDSPYMRAMYDRIPYPWSALRYGNGTADVDRGTQLASIRNYILAYAIFRMRGGTARTRILSRDPDVLETIYHVTHAMHTGQSLDQVRHLLEARGGLPDAVLATMILDSKPCATRSGDALQCLYERFTYRQRRRSKTV